MWPLSKRLYLLGETHCNVVYGCCIWTRDAGGYKLGLELGVSSMERLLVSTGNFEQRGNFDN